VIASVRGTLVMLDGERAVIEVGGLGLEVLASSRTLGSLSPHRGQEVSLYTYLNVREDALQLFGFRDPGERTFFLWLTAVSGVGPKVALAVLSGYPVAELELAVARDDVKKFESISGIGKKLAARLVVELGLSLREAEEALRGAPEDAPLEELVKYALTHKADE
jgi:Holliday junction DNA helicase RuvA